MIKINIKIIVIVLVILAAVIFGIFSKKLGIVKDDYSIVYLSTGEVYIGKLTTFPDLQIKDIYILQITKDEKDPTKNNFQLNPIKDALWAPKSLHLVKDNLIFYGPLMSDSVIAKKLEEQVK
ncbi:hypothetical protein A3I95_00025 [Candidatus Nomurabacteria bacterium RIFCSPLOWO2_02_FULL_44_12]|nr:MAG: hypothetical protein A3E95_01160 [Candidatus Nomurabacteria bacterium RIFCSPHIGHO2_12_FULL_44_22b]OGJ07350.1 MAG: hypothetical protein A3I95_00025 [Candidatus Nomurabacteria bacterium RIFCSPLOWO2_02_FULL_44_12]